MKIYTYLNKGIILLEYIIINLFFIIFLSIFLIFINRIKLIKFDINSTTKYDNINEICNKIVINILESKKIDIKNNIIKLDNIKIMKREDYLVVYSSSMEKYDKLFKIKEFNVYKEDNKLKLLFILDKNNKIIRLISLK